MKKKKFNKKLVLNKRTITNLGNGEMRILNGGDLTDTCPRQCSEPPEACDTWPVLQCESVKNCDTRGCTNYCTVVTLQCDCTLEC